ncbi:MAG: hypothetical protein ABL904_17095 [Hyphomicrobiaceae bacterium]
MTIPTEADFRKVGYTADAINYPLSEAAIALKAKLNGVTPDQLSPANRYAPNDWVQLDLEARAKNEN